MKTQDVCDTSSHAFKKWLQFYINHPDMFAKHLRAKGWKVYHYKNREKTYSRKYSIEIENTEFGLIFGEFCEKKSIGCWKTHETKFRKILQTQQA